MNFDEFLDVRPTKCVFSRIFGKKLIFTSHGQMLALLPVLAPATVMFCCHLDCR